MNILLADDHTLFRESLSVVLETTFPGSSITSIKSWSEVLSCTDSRHYDLLLLDLFMPNIDSDDWSSSLGRVVKSQNGAVCVISASNNRAHIQSAFRLGVNGYLCKTSTLQQMKQALQQISEGKTYLPEQMWDKKPHKKKSKNSPNLTWRQREVMELVVEGGSNKLIAQQLELAESTVKRHVYNTYRALGAKNRADAIRIAQLENLLGN